MTNVRKQKSGDQLAPGDWLAPGEILDGAAEVLFAHSYAAFADRSRDNDGEHVQLVVREQGAVRTHADVVAGAALFDLASDEDLAKLREAAERAQFVAGLREFAAWVETNQWAPIKRNSGYVGEARVQIDLHAAGDAGAADVALVREIAGRLGVKVDESLDDRTDASIKIGSVSYSVIAWHPTGRPAEPAPVPSGAVADEQDVEYARRVAEAGDAWVRSGPASIDPDSSMEAHYDAETEASPPPARFWPGWDVVRKGGMPPGFPPSLRVSRVIPIDGSGITTPQRWQFRAVGRNEWFHCDDYERAV